MRFEFATATRIVFGAGALAEVGDLAAGLGKRPLVVFDGDLVRVQSLLDLLDAQGLPAATFAVEKEPSTDLVQAGCAVARDAGCDMVISLGGGSVIDTGKAIAALLTNGGDPLDYLEVIGKGQPLAQPSAPFIAIPTTAGTGAEVTRNAVLLSLEHKVKVSLRSPYMLPTVALVDPALTTSMPPAVTASTGLDALTQVIEPFVSHLANPLTDALCRDGIKRAARSLRQAYQQPADGAARADMALASLFGGLALANAKLGAVHGFAGVLGGMFPAPHGVVCARLLPEVMAANITALQERDPNNPALVRYDEVAQIVTGQADAGVAAGVAWVQELCRVLAVPPLSDYGLTETDFPAVITAAARSSSMKGNPIVLTEQELAGILQEAR